MMDLLIRAVAVLLALAKMIVSIILITIYQPVQSLAVSSTPILYDSPRVILITVGILYTIIGIAARRMFSRKLVYGLVYLIVGLLLIAVVCIPYEHLANLQSSYIQIAMVLSSLAYLCVTSEQLTVMRKQLEDNKKAMQLSKQPCISVFPISNLVCIHGYNDPQIHFECIIENCGDSPALNVQTSFFTREIGKEAIARHSIDVAVIRATDSTPSFNRKDVNYHYTYTKQEIVSMSKGEFMLMAETSYLNVYGTCFRTSESFFLDLRDRKSHLNSNTTDSDMMSHVLTVLAPGQPFKLIVRRDPFAYTTAVVEGTPETEKATLDAQWGSRFWKRRTQPRHSSFDKR